MVIAKFHYTDTDTDPTRTKSAHVVGYELNYTTRARPDPHGPNGVSPQKKSVRVRSGPCRVRVRVRVVEFSYNWQDYYGQDASRGHSAIAELLINVEVKIRRLPTLLLCDVCSTGSRRDVYKTAVCSLVA